MKKVFVALALAAFVLPAYAQEPDPVQAKILAELARINKRMDKLEAKVDDALAMFAAERAEKDAAAFAAAAQPPPRQTQPLAAWPTPATGAAPALMLPGGDVCGPGGCGATGRGMTRVMVRGRR